MRYTKLPKEKRKYIKPKFKKGDMIVCSYNDFPTIYAYKIVGYQINHRKYGLSEKGQCNNFYVCTVIKGIERIIEKEYELIGIGSTAEKNSKVVTKEELTAYLL